MASSVGELLDLIIAKITTGGRRITGAKAREVFNEITNSNLNLVTGGTVEGPVEFKDNVIITDDGGLYRWKLKFTSQGIPYGEKI